MPVMQEPQIIFEDADILVLDKPVGLVVHSDGRTNEPTLVDWLLEHYPQMRGIGEPWVRDTGTVIERPGIVHRLDRETSGVMVIAKTQEAYEHLKAQFQNREIKKEYIAVVHGVFKDDALSGVVDKPIGKSPKDFRRWSAQPGARGHMRAAVTRYTVQEQVGQGASGFALVALRPMTGRTHQLRVHMKAIHHAIVGDSLYGVSEDVPRMLLHAHRLMFTHPTTGERAAYTVAVPQGFDLPPSSV